MMPISALNFRLNPSGMAGSLHRAPMFGENVSVNTSPDLALTPVGTPMPPPVLPSNAAAPTMPQADQTMLPSNRGTPTLLGKVIAKIRDANTTFSKPTNPSTAKGQEPRAISPENMGPLNALPVGTPDNVLMKPDVFDVFNDPVSKAFWNKKKPKFTLTPEEVQSGEVPRREGEALQELLAQNWNSENIFLPYGSNH